MYHRRALKISARAGFQWTVPGMILLNHIILSNHMKSCITCGMPLVGDHASDVGLELPEGLVCKFDSENGKVKSGEQVFEGGIMFFVSAVTDGDRDLAERLTRRNMNSLPYWRQHPFAMLVGAEATPEQHQAAMEKLSSQHI